MLLKNLLKILLQTIKEEKHYNIDNYIFLSQTYWRPPCKKRTFKMIVINDHNTVTELLNYKMCF